MVRGNVITKRKKFFLCFFFVCDRSKALMSAAIGELFV